MPGEELERLVCEHGEDFSVSPLLVEHPNFPPQAFLRLAESDEPSIRHLALKNDDLPATLVSVLAVDPAPHVRRAAAEHRNLPVSCLPALLTDDDLQVVEAAGAAPAFPTPWMHQLLDAHPSRPDRSGSSSSGPRGGGVVRPV
ncbi:Leucine rich repeat variant [Thermomonospora echinospora]|uniref:Leucine rich repeat variant n=1 Tax=Thermomonospora echinospora TaxID=1992 RepID=A0A1H6AY50_9ACTN|nr:Leucine rich repeat variant [Thermomonospora echinospora]